MKIINAFLLTGLISSCSTMQYNHKSYDTTIRLVKNTDHQRNIAKKENVSIITVNNDMPYLISFKVLEETAHILGCDDLNNINITDKFAQGHCIVNLTHNINNK